MTVTNSLWSARPRRTRSTIPAPPGTTESIPHGTSLSTPAQPLSASPTNTPPRRSWQNPACLSATDHTFPLLDRQCHSGITRPMPYDAAAQPAIPCLQFDATTDFASPHLDLPSTPLTAPHPHGFHAPGLGTNGVVPKSAPSYCRPNPAMPRLASPNCPLPIAPALHYHRLPGRPIRTQHCQSGPARTCLYWTTHHQPGRSLPAAPGNARPIRTRPIQHQPRLFLASPSGPRQHSHRHAFPFRPHRTVHRSSDPPPERTRRSLPSRPSRANPDRTLPMRDAPFRHRLASPDAASHKLAYPCRHRLNSPVQS